MSLRHAIAFAGGALTFAGAASAIEFNADLQAEGRWFNQSHATTSSVAGTFATSGVWDLGRQHFGVELFGRYDQDDAARTHADFRELYYEVVDRDFEFRAGSRRLFWGTTESRHLVDIVNQTDFVEDIDAEEKLGQPMMNLAMVRELGTFDVILMPYQRLRTYPGREGFPQMPLPVEAHDPLYESPRQYQHLDLALRFFNTFGPLDLGVAWFDGTAREPHLLPCLRRGSGLPGTADGPNCSGTSSSGNPGLPGTIGGILTGLGLVPGDPSAQQQVQENLVFIPYYDLLRQGSIDARYVIGESLTLKLEALRRQQHQRWTSAAVTGFEYTFGDVRGSGIDIGVLGEYLYDQDREFLRALEDDEVYAGLRLGLNDESSTQFLLGFTAARKDFQSRRYQLETSRRIREDWKVALEAHLFTSMPSGSVEDFLSDQDFVRLTVDRYF